MLKKESFESILEECLIKNWITEKEEELENLLKKRREESFMHNDE